MSEWFNAEQNDYIKYLASRLPETKCYCGWWDKGKCRDCPPQLSAADKLAVRCPSCDNEPWHSDPRRPITHRRGCKTPDYQPTEAMLAAVFDKVESK